MSIISSRDLSFPVRTEMLVSIREAIRELYLLDNRPWIIGYSGGKDSTVLLQLVFESLVTIPRYARAKPVFIVSSDTRVENPNIVGRVNTELLKVEAAAKTHGLPMSTHVVFPILNDTFWVNLIGRGYPSPNSSFRWCTDRLKIKPTSRFIKTLVHSSGEVVLLLGNRKAESQTRSRNMLSHQIDGERLRPHATLSKAWISTPIEDLTNDEVWLYLLQVPSFWGGDNKGLVSLYRRASGGECPLVVDRSTPSCGNSRFGCWTCTVVTRDKSIEGLIETGEAHLEFLLDYREYLQAIRDTPGARYSTLRDGRRAVRRGTGEAMSNTGPFTHLTRQDLLRRLLETQKATGLTLVEGDELALIQQIWNREERLRLESTRVRTHAVQQIWDHVFKEGPMPFEDDSLEALERENRLLAEVCDEHGISFDMLARLREIEEEYGHLKRRHGLPEDMREIITSYVAAAEEEGLGEKT